MTEPIYLDYNATTPLDSEVRGAMKPFFDFEFGNPSSTHWYGIRPRKAVAHAREQVAGLLNCSPEEIIFTSGGTESNNQAIKGMAAALRDRGNHIITTTIEHPAVLEVCRHLENSGFQITRIPVDDFGLIDVTELERSILPETILITIMHANNEVGTVEPITEISRVAKSKGILLHSDAAQTIGKIPTDVQALGVDLLSVAGHKIYAPKGIGALYIRKSLAPDIFMHGAGQEMGKRAGTENVMGIVGLGKACEVAGRDLEENSARMRKTRDALYSGLKESITEIRRNGHPEKVLPNTLSISFSNAEADRILEEIGLTVAASAGAACHSDRVEISHVLKAMGISEKWAKGTIRFSTGKQTSEKDVARVVKSTAQAISRLRSI